MVQRFSSTTDAANHAAPSLSPFPATWLRDNCDCATCRDAVSGQKLTDLADVPVDTTVREVVETADAVTVVFSPDGHRSTFTRAWLAEQRQRAASGDGRTERDKELWAAADLPDPLPRTSWTEYRDDSDERARALRRVLRTGFALLTATPTEDQTVAEIAATLGHIRETNYGKVFDVRVKPDPHNLAFTSRALAPHTDNPYRDPVPTIQLLHCLTGAVEGGASGLIDGFYAAAFLRRHDPDAFDVLSSTLVTFSWSDAETRLRAERPIIDLDPNGHIREVRFNNRSMTLPILSPTQTRVFHAAYRRLAAIIARPALQIWFRLEPGDCLIMDNTRVLHARSPFTATAEPTETRHLQGCYADLDGLSSTLATLEAAR